MAWFKKIENFHPLQTLIYVAFVGICVLFIGFLIPFTIALKTAPQPQAVRIPVTFYISTFVILLASYFYKRGRYYYQNDDIKNHFRWLLAGFLLNIVFAALQIAGWKILAQQNVSIRTGITNPKVYLYILSGVHLFHLAGGLIFYVLQIFKAGQAMVDPVKQMLFVSERIEKLRLKLLGEYWQMLGILWIVIFLYFLVMFN